MKRKGFCFKQVISLLLAAAMILTAAPQAGMTAFAAENSDTSADQQLLSVDDAFADAGSDENDTDVDTTQPEDGQDETQLPEESGDGSENGGDVPPEEPGQEGNPDDAEEPGEITEPADGQEGDGEDTEGIVSEEETVSENTLAAGLMENDDPEKQEKSEEYSGLIKEEQHDGKTYKVLEIGAFERMDLNNGEPWTDAQIFEKLKKWQAGTEKFECVRLWINDTGASSRVIKKDFLNAAVTLLNTKDPEKECQIDYTFQKYEPGKESCEFTSFLLFDPGAVTSDIKANVTVTPVAGQGVKLKFPGINFNADHVVVNFGNFANWDDIQKNLEGAGGGDANWNNSPYYLFMLKSGQPEAYKDELFYNADCDMKDKRFWVSNLLQLKANTEYLIAPIKNLESMSAGETKTLTPPAGAANVKWKSYTPDIVSIDASGNLTAWEQGEALYGVIYKESGVQKAQFYRIMVENKLGRMKFISDTVTMETGRQEGLHLNFFPSDFGCNPTNPDEIKWEITKQEPLLSGNSVIMFGHYEEEEKETDNPGKGDIIALNPGTATVKATYVPSANTESPITAECTITVKGRLDWDDVADEVENMDLYAVSGCDTKLSDVKFPEGTESEWKWKDPDLSLAPYAGLENHEFTAICTRDGGWSGEHTIAVRMINVTGIAMKSRVPKSASPEGDQWDAWKEWWIPTTLEKDDQLSLGFYYNLDGIRWIEDENGGYFDPVQTAAVEAKLAQKYAVEWSSSPNKLGQQKGDDTYEYTAAVAGKKAEKKTFMVSLKDKTTNKVVWKASHTLTVTPNPLFDDWDLIEEVWKNKEIDDTTGKLTGMTLKIKMSKEDYDKWKFKFESLDTGILQLGKLAVTEETATVEGKETKTTVVKVPCTQKSFGRVWIKVTAQDDVKSSATYMINLEDPAPTLLGTATQTINKASSVKSVPIIVSTSAGFPLAKNGNNLDVSIQEVKIGGKDASGYFELTDITDSSDASDSEPYIGGYSMNLGLKGNDLSGVKAGNYAVKLKLKTTAAKNNEYSLSLTVKVTDVKPKVTFKQTKKVNLFYTDDEGAGTLQINSGEKITKVELKNYVDNKNSNKNADCHYEVKSEGDNGNVYKIVRKSGQNGAQPDGSLKKGILEYTVEGYAGTFQTTFTVATENKAPAIMLSTKADMLYPSVGYCTSRISMTDKSTGSDLALTEAKYYTAKGKNREEKSLVIGTPSDITGSASGNGYKLSVDTRGNVVSEYQDSANAGKNNTKADTINLEIREANWSKPVAVSYKLQVNTAVPKLALGKATLTLNKNEEVYRGQQERTALRLKGFNDLIGNNTWVSITGQDDKSKAELKGKDSSLVMWYWSDCGDVGVRFNDNDIAPGTYKFKISVGKNGGREYASAVLTVKIVDKAVKQSLKVTAKGSIDVLNREGTFISYTPKISNLTGTVVGGRLEGKDANLFDCSFEDGKLIVRASEGRRYSTKITYEVHTVFRVQTEDWRGYEVSSDNDAKAKPFKIKVKQGKPKLTVTAVGGNTLYRQRNNSVEFRVNAVLGKQEIKIDDVQQTDYWSDLWMYYDWENQIVHVGIIDGDWGEIRKNGTYKPKLKVEYRDRAGDVKDAEIVCPIVVR